MKKATLCFTMDNLGDAADLHRGVIDRPRPPGQRPALEQGFPALLSLFQRFDIPLTHFIEGWSAEQYPEQIDQIQSAGYEIGMHGWQHERWADLSMEDMERLATRATEALTRACGQAPQAFRAPGGARPAWASPILENLGYRIDASLAPDTDPQGEIKRLSPRLCAIPYTWDGVDASYWLWKQVDNEAVLSGWQQWVERAIDAGTYLTFIWHPHVMGIDAERVAIGERFLDWLKTRAEDIDIVSLSTLWERHCAAPVNTPELTS